MMPGQIMLNGLVPQGYMWDMYRHPTAAAAHNTENFKEKRERRRRVERTRELMSVQGVGPATLQEVRGNVHKLSKDQVLHIRA